MSQVNTTRERLTRIETMLEALHRRVLGNGDGGALEHLESRVARVEAQLQRLAGFGLAWRIIAGLIAGSLGAAALMRLWR